MPTRSLPPSLPPPPLTRVLGLEVGLALQRGRQVVEAQRQLPLEGGILLAERRESPEGTLTHQLLDGRVAPGDGVGSAGLWTLHRRRGSLRWRGSARWEGRDSAGRLCRTKQTLGSLTKYKTHYSRAVLSLWFLMTLYFYSLLFFLNLLSFQNIDLLIFISESNQFFY